MPFVGIGAADPMRISVDAALYGGQLEVQAPMNSIRRASLVSLIFERNLSILRGWFGSDVCSPTLSAESRELVLRYFSCAKLVLVSLVGSVLFGIWMVSAA